MSSYFEVVCVFVVVGAAVGIAVRDTHAAGVYHEYTNAKGDPVLVNDLSLVPEARRHTLRRKVVPRYDSPPRRDAQPADKPQTRPVSGEKNSRSLMDIAREYKIELGAVAALIVLMCLYPGVTWRRILPAVIGVIVLSILVNQLSGKHDGDKATAPPEGSRTVDETKKHLKKAADRRADRKRRAFDADNNAGNQH